MEYQIEIKPKRTAARDSILTKSEFALMMQATNDGKDQIIIALGLLGLRASEIAACQRAWVDFAQQTINLPTGVTKRCRGRIVPFGKFRVLREIITSFFMLEKAVGLSRIGVYQRVQRIASRAGITHPVTVHGLRATGATLTPAASDQAIPLPQRSKEDLESFRRWNEERDRQIQEGFRAFAKKRDEALAMGRPDLIPVPGN